MLIQKRQAMCFTKIGIVSCKFTTTRNFDHIMMQWMCCLHILNLQAHILNFLLFTCTLCPFTGWFHLNLLLHSVWSLGSHKHEIVWDCCEARLCHVSGHEASTKDSRCHSISIDPRPLSSAPLSLPASYLQCGKYPERLPSHHLPRLISTCCVGLKAAHSGGWR